MIEKLEALEKKYEELTHQMASPEVLADPKQLQSIAKERASLEGIITKFADYKATVKSLEETRAMLTENLDAEMASLVKEEIKNLLEKKERLFEELKEDLIPKDPNDEKDVIMEIRAGTGGDEAALFAADLFRMYSRYAQEKNWDIDIIDVSEGAAGGYKEIIFEVKGKGAFSRLKYERGVHRVQRVPVTEASGRIHTSTATVAVLPEADEVDIDINPDDLRIDIFHSSGAGGQNVNKVATAVRVTHIPTGTVVVCQDERSQLRNRQKAMMVLRTRLLDAERRKQEEQITEERRAQVGTGERAEKIRTYNFPQDRVTDHRIGQNFHNLPAIMEGQIDEIIEALITHYRLEATLSGEKQPA
ncbi:MAG: peptide chain release factor 1 [Dehalococcoidales bacterium]|jgi:peptide chain release factor 1|nr:peptide chain release factor 1 [Dehalococcoidales bacterium]